MVLDFPGVLFVKVGVACVSSSTGCCWMIWWLVRKASSHMLLMGGVIWIVLWLINRNIWISNACPCNCWTYTWHTCATWHWVADSVKISLSIFLDLSNILRLRVIFLTLGLVSLFQGPWLVGWCSIGEIIIRRN